MLPLPPIFTIAPPCENSGSGKFGTPCERMQAEKRRSCSCSFACSAGDGALPAGMSFLHARCADRNCGESGLIPLPGPTETLKSPPLEGSGKFRIPCERMQAEKERPAAPGELVPLDPLELP